MACVARRVHIFVCTVVARVYRCQHGGKEVRDAHECIDRNVLHEEAGLGHVDLGALRGDSPVSRWYRACKKEVGSE